jgi:prepilin peptidase CpaA
MRLPNMLTLSVVALFFIVMPFLVPLNEVGLRFGIGLAALVLGFVLSVSGLIGAGDAKFGAAGVLFIHPSVDHISLFVQVLAMTALAGVATHRLFRQFGFARAMGAGWQSWEETTNFPFGLSIASALLFYQLIVVIIA